RSRMADSARSTAVIFTGVRGFAALAMVRFGPALYRVRIREQSDQTIGKKHIRDAGTATGAGRTRRAREPLPRAVPLPSWCCSLPLRRAPLQEKDPGLPKRWRRR